MQEHPASINFMEEVFSAGQKVIVLTETGDIEGTFKGWKSQQLGFYLGKERLAVVETDSGELLYLDTWKMAPLPNGE